MLGVMLFRYGVRSIHIESCAVFARGGVYRIVIRPWAVGSRGSPNPEAIHRRIRSLRLNVLIAPAKPRG
jgi:hypothetical protein